MSLANDTSTAFRVLLPGPAASQLNLQRKAEKCADENDNGQYANCFEGQFDGDGVNDVCGDEELQAKEDASSETLSDLPKCRFGFILLQYAHRAKG